MVGTADVIVGGNLFPGIFEAFAIGRTGIEIAVEVVAGIDELFVFGIFLRIFGVFFAGLQFGVGNGDFPLHFSEFMTAAEIPFVIVEHDEDGSAEE